MTVTATSTDGQSSSFIIRFSVVPGELFLVAHKTEIFSSIVHFIHLTESL